MLSVVNNYFPDSITLAELEKRVTKRLKKMDIEPHNTLLALSTCSDEIERRIEKKFSEKWNLGFWCGGLSGQYFIGPTGTSAMIHHIPDSGNLLLIYCSHVGVTRRGKIGMVERRGMKKPTTCCGAAIGAYESQAPIDNDDQENYVKSIIAQNKSKFTDNEQQNMIMLPNIIQKQIRADVMALLADYPNVKVILVGGININTKKEDFFKLKDFGMLYNGEYRPLKF